MDQTKYASVIALFQLIGNAGKLGAVPGTVVQKLEGEITLVPEALSFIPLAPQLGAELALLVQSPADLVAAGELLIADFGFTSEKAQAIIAAASAMAEEVVNAIPKIQALLAAFKA
jgi:hypothetical protein